MTNNIVAIQGNHPKTLIPNSDTTIFLAVEAQKKKYKIFYYEPKNLSIIKSVNPDAYVTTDLANPTSIRK